MSFTKNLLATAVACVVAIPALAQDLMIHDAYIRTSGASAKSGAAFMHIMNKTTEDDRLIGASSDVAKRIELHTHKENGDGVMQMIEVEEGFPVPASGMHELARGGDHVMFMGLTRSLKQGDIVNLTLTFEKAGDVVVEVPVDLERDAGMGMQHGTEGHMHGEGGMAKQSDG